MLAHDELSSSWEAWRHALPEDLGFMARVVTRNLETQAGKLKLLVSMPPVGAPPPKWVMLALDAEPCLFALGAAILYAQYGYNADPAHPTWMSEGPILFAAVEQAKARPFVDGSWNLALLRDTRRADFAAPPPPGSDSAEAEWGSNSVNFLRALCEEVVPAIDSCIAGASVAPHAILGASLGAHVVLRALLSDPPSPFEAFIVASPSDSKFDRLLPEFKHAKKRPDDRALVINGSIESLGVRQTAAKLVPMLRCLDVKTTAVTIDMESHGTVKASIASRSFGWLYGENAWHEEGPFGVKPRDFGTSYCDE